MRRIQRDKRYVHEYGVNKKHGASFILVPHFPFVPLLGKRGLKPG